MSGNPEEIYAIKASVKYQTQHGKRTINGLPAFAPGAAVYVLPPKNWEIEVVEVIGFERNLPALTCEKVRTEHLEKFHVCLVTKPDLVRVLTIRKSLPFPLDGNEACKNALEMLVNALLQNAG